MSILASLLLHAYQSRASYADEGAVDQSANATDNVLLYFFADWCGPCQEIKPMISRFERNGATIRSINVDTDEELVRQYTIETIPTIVVVINGLEESRQSGKISESELRSLLNRLPKSGPAKVDSLQPDRPELNDQKFELQTQQLAAKVRAANAHDRVVLEKQLLSLTERHFDYRQSQRIYEINCLDERLSVLRKQRERRQANKSAILKRRMKDLTDPDASRSWDEVSAENGAHPTDTQRLPDPEQIGTSVEKAPVSNQPKILSGGTFDPREEQTYDGIPYSQWLKLLETERKPEKLISAIDACGRLAQENDTRRIIHGIFHAASLFEGNNFNSNGEQGTVWNASTEALQRMPRELIVEELITAFRDKTSYKSGRRFQLETLDPFRRVISSGDGVRVPELIGAVLSLMDDPKLDREEVLAGAANVWGQSGRPLSDFPELKSLALKAIEIGPAKPVSDQYGGHFLGSWRTIVSSLVDHAPDTPDLAEKLRKYLNYEEVIVSIRGLGPRASVLVPDLIERFLKEWKTIAISESPDVNEKQRPPRHGSGHSICCSIIFTLGAIGPNEKSATLLKEIKLSTLIDSNLLDSQRREVLSSVNDCLKLVGTIPDQDSAPLLSDDILIQGHWRRENSITKSNPSGENCFFQNAGYSLHGANGVIIRMAGVQQDGFPISSQFQIDPKQWAKRIEFVEYSYASDGNGISRRVEDSDTRRAGIYELTESTLRIQVAKQGNPAPTEFVKDASELPEGQFLYQFRRKWPPEDLD